MASFQQLIAFRRELLITDKYRITRRIGGGSFGDIYLGINIANGEVSNNFSYSYDDILVSFE